MLRAAYPEIRQIPAPRDPTRSDDSLDEIEVMEWLDRPFPEPSSVRRESDLSRVLATVYITSGTIRLSSPRVDTLEIAEEKLRRILGAETKAIERVAAPLPLPFLDADVWTVRLPEELDRDLAHSLSREALECYYENQWIHRPRQGLDGLTPLAASQDARRGDAVARAKLAAVLQVREQLGSRGSAVAMYQGYPFDRLRRRLGLDLVHPDSVDLQDLSCAALPNCRSRRPTTLTTSAWWTRSCPRPGSAMMSSPPGSRRNWCRRKPDQLGKLDLSAVYAPLVRQSIQRGNTDEALDWLLQAGSLGSDSTRQTFDTWRAEIFSRTGRPDLAARIYDGLVKSSASSPQVALDAAETLMDNRHFDHARSFLERARDLAQSTGIPWIQGMASHHLKSLSRKHA